MSRIDDSASAPVRAERKRLLLSRRSVLQGAASAGAAGVAAAALVNAGLPAAAEAMAPARPVGAPGRARAGESVVVHIRDIATGEMDVFRGTTHIRVRDKEITARFARARPAAERSTPPCIRNSPPATTQYGKTMSPRPPP